MDNASKVIKSAIETYAALRGITTKEAMDAYESNGTARDSILLLIYGGLVK